MISKQVNKFSMSCSILGAILAILFAALPAFAADKVQTWTGYLIDRSCAAMIKKESKDIPRQVKDHSKSCGLDAACCEAGYSVYSQGQWIDLDTASSQVAHKLLEASKKNKGHMVKVTGVVKRGEVKASSIVEVN